jgi:hypothetical protein
MKLKQQHRIVFLFTCILAILAAAMSVDAAAREFYSWTDENGVVHYGDLPPKGQSVQTIQDDVSDRPGNTGPETDSDAAIADDTEGEDDGPVKSLAQQRREELAKARKEKREAQAEMDRMCDIHRKARDGIEPTRRVFYTDENGERTRLDNDQRLALLKQAKDFLAKNCE